jgi:glyoxylase-like metal-dependent hydrolase (beta-lactamase superfamily II)
VRAVSLHPDVIVVTSALLQVNCVIVRGRAGEGSAGAAAAAGSAPGAGAPADAGRRSAAGAGRRSAAGAGETFVIDSPVLPDELDALGALIEQAGFPAPAGLLATHGDWDHVLGPLAFPQAPLGCASRTAERLAARPGEPQRELRDFDEDLCIERPRPLALGSVQSLPVPGRCELGAQELELHATEGHTADGMAVMIPWAGVLVAGDYLSSIELPALNEGDRVDAYTATLERLRPLVERAGHVVPGHGPVLDTGRALGVLDEDLSYLETLPTCNRDVELPVGRRTRQQRKLHAANLAALGLSDV